MKRRRVIFISILLLIAAFAFLLWCEEQRERKFIPQIRAAAHRYGVEPALIKAVVWRESHFYPRAGGHGRNRLDAASGGSRAGVGRCGTPAEFEHEHCFDPGTNTLAGAWYLRKLLRRYAQADNPLPYALADYNAGRGNVLKWNRARRRRTARPSSVKSVSRAPGIT